MRSGMVSHPEALSARYTLVLESAPDGIGRRTRPRGEHNGVVVLSAEITTSTEPRGLIDSRMRDTLQKLSSMAGQRFYFTASPAMCQRARTKIRKGGWHIEAVHLAAVANAL